MKWPWRRPEAREQELNREIEWHLNELAEERQAEGQAPQQARHAARRDFGNVALIREDTRQVWGWLWLNRLAQDGRYALRLLARGPGFTAVAVLVFALGIGANTAVFSLINSLMLRTLPVEKPEQLVLLATQRQTGDPSSDFSYPYFREVRSGTKSYQDVFGYSSIDALKTSLQGETETATGAQVSGSFFPTLGVHAWLGRVLGPDDEGPSEIGFVSVISHDYWRHKFSADPAVIGKTIRLNDRPYTIAGVIQPEFHGVQVGVNPDVFVLMTQFSPSLLEAEDTLWMSAAARLKPEVTAAQASAELNAIYQRHYHNAQGFLKPGRRDYMLAVPFARGQSLLGSEFSKPLAILMGAVGLVLIIACANLANLLLARAEARRKEMAVRLAIGAGRARLIRQLLTESLILAVAGTALGLLFSQWSRGLLLRIASRGPHPLFVNMSLDLAVLGFATALAIVTTLLFGLAPAIRATRVDPYPELKCAGASVSGRGSGAGPGRALVVFQIALSVALVIGAGLLARTLGNLHSFDAGFDRDNILLFAIEPATSGYHDDRLMNLYATVLETLRTLPGVKSAGMSRFRPMTPGQMGGTIRIADDPDPGARRNIQGNMVDTGGFFETLKIPVFLGRAFTRTDTNKSPKVAVINETAARQFFPGRNPLGRRFFRSGAEPIEVVGVARDARYHNLREPPVRMVYFPYSQQAPNSLERMHFVLRTTRDAAALAPEIRAIMRQAAREVPVVDVNTLTEQIDRTLLRERLLATLSSFFAALGSIVAAVGLYGLMAFRVTRRRSEIGIRMALGAQRSDVLVLILREALLLVLSGAAAGLLIAWPATKLLSSLLFGLDRYDPATIAGAVIGLVFVSGLAAWLPARRALRIDALTALRYE